MDVLYLGEKSRRPRKSGWVVGEVGATVSACVHTFFDFSGRGLYVTTRVEMTCRPQVMADSNSTWAPAN